MNTKISISHTTGALDALEASHALLNALLTELHKSTHDVALVGMLLEGLANHVTVVTTGLGGLVAQLSEAVEFPRETKNVSTREPTALRLKLVR